MSVRARVGVRARVRARVGVRAGARARVGAGVRHDEELALMKQVDAEAIGKHVAVE